MFLLFGHLKKIEEIFVINLIYAILILFRINNFSFSSFLPPSAKTWIKAPFTKLAFLTVHLLPTNTWWPPVVWSQTLIKKMLYHALHNFKLLSPHWLKRNLFSRIFSQKNTNSIKLPLNNHPKSIQSQSSSLLKWKEKWTFMTLV